MNLELSNIIRNQVCIVGNAQSLLSSHKGDLIDDFSTIIRLNRGYPLQPEHQGTRTHLVGLSCSVKEKDFDKYYGNAAIAWMTPKRDKLASWMSTRPDFFMYPVDYWDNLYEQFGGKRPSTGAMMIDLICNHVEPERLLIIGFDFKKSKTFYSRKDHLGPHDWKIEEQFAYSTVEKGRSKGLDWNIVEGEADQNKQPA